MTDVTIAQQIKNRFQLGPASHMTHIKSLQQILADGGLSSYKRMRERQYQSLANEDVQAGRALIVVQVSQMQLHDYVSPWILSNVTRKCSLIINPVAQLKA